MAEQKTLVLVDGHALTFRAFFALESTRMAVRSTGEPTYAVQGFFQILLNLLRDYRPEYVAVSFDVGRTFRDELYSDYKAGRSETPVEFHSQLDRIKQIIQALNIPIYTADGYEADDVIGTLARQAGAQGVRTLIITGDTDTLQLVDDHTQVLLANPYGQKTNVTLYDEAKVIERYQGLRPNQLADLRGLKGDTSDNIPGVKGIGEKGAINLLNQFGSIEELYQHLEDVPNRYRSKLEGQKEAARFSKHLATIVTDVPITLDIAATVVHEYDRSEVVALFRELEFLKLIDKLPVTGHGIEVEALPVTSGGALQLGMFQTAAPSVTPKLEGDYTIVTTPAALEAVVAALAEADCFAFDTETTGLHLYGPEPVAVVGISLAVGDQRAWYIPIAHQEGEQLPAADVIAALRPAFADPDKGRVAHNAKFDLMALEQLGIPVGAITFDPMLAAQLLGERPALKELAFNRLRDANGAPIEMTKIEELIGSGKSQITMDRVAYEQAGPYACADADMTLRLANELGPQLAAHEHLQRVLIDIELPLTPVLARMESAGIGVDGDQLARLRQDFGRQLLEIETAIAAQTAAPLNIQSRYDLNDLLFQHLKLPTAGLKKLSGTTKSGGPVYSLTADVLESLADVDQSGIVAMILRHRRLSKLKSTYVDTLHTLINPRTGRVHTQYRQIGAETGRLSSEAPNLQNIPVRSEEGREIRRAFVAAPGKLLLAADYSQIELRVLAHVTQDPALVEVFQTGQDIHAATAARLYDVPMAEVTKNQRRIAKMTTFGIIYGISSFGLSARTELSRSEAQAMIDGLFRQYPGLERYIAETIELVQRQGYVETLFGRRRHFKELLGANVSVQARNAAQREAINAGIQGTAADLIKLAMINLDKALGESGLDATMLLQVHDELVLEVSEGDLAATAALVREHMEGAYPAFRVPIEVNIEAGPNWDDLRPIH